MTAQRNPEGIAKTAARLKTLYTAAVCNIMDEMGLPHQCLHLGLKSLEQTTKYERL